MDKGNGRLLFPSTNIPLQCRIADSLTQDERLLEALQSYEDEKWRIVAQRVGGGVTPMGCFDRVWELFNDDIDDASQFSFANSG